MEKKGIDSTKKRKKTPEEKDEVEAAETVDVEAGTESLGSEEMEANISRVIQKVEQYTQQLSELLEAGRKVFRDLSDEFEEKMSRIHQEQVNKWAEEIKELRLLDSANEEINARLNNIQYLLQNFNGGS